MCVNTTFWGVCAHEYLHICRPKVAMRNCPQLLLHFSHWGRASQTNPELTSMMWLVLLTSLLLGVLCLHFPRLGVQAGHHTYLHLYGFLGQEFLSSYLQGKRHLLSHLPNPVSFFLSFQTTAPLFRCFGVLGGGDIPKYIVLVYEFFVIGTCYSELTFLREDDTLLNVSYHQVGLFVKLLAYGTYKTVLDWSWLADCHLVDAS